VVVLPGGFHQRSLGCRRRRHSVGRSPRRPARGPVWWV